MGQKNGSHHIASLRSPAHSPHHFSVCASSKRTVLMSGLGEGRQVQFKLVILGEGCVGKTSLLLRYCNNTFDERHNTTIQAHYLPKRLNIDGNRVLLSIWDTAGQERFHALGPIYYRDSNGALLVYDITDRDSFERVQHWVRELVKMLGNTCQIVIVGNKIDLERNRNVTVEEAEEYAASVGATHFQTSAKLNKGLDEVFLHISKRMLAAGPSTSGGGGGAAVGGVGPRGSRSQLMIADDDPPAARPQESCSC